MQENQENTSPLVISSSLSLSVPEVPRLVAILTCPVCYELQEHPTSTPCHHTFCSLCIRKYLQFKPQCPTCHCTVYEQNLRADKTAEDVVMLVRPLINNLEKLIISKPAGKEKLNNQKENEDPSNQLSNSPGIQRSNTLPLSPVKMESTNIVSKPSQQPILKVKGESELLTHPNRTPCPVCSVPIPNRAIDQHVEKCLATRKAPPPVIKPVKKRSALPKLVYALLKDAELKKKCREFGLNQKGDRKSLINRLQKYTLLYNTESQLDNPKSKLEIVMQVEREEKEEKAGKVPTPSLLQFDRKTESEVIEQKQKQYLKENKDTFNDMIKQVRERNKQKAKKCVESKTSSSDVINLVDTVENLEDITAAKGERKSIEDLSEAEYWEPIFEVLPGPSKVVTSDLELKANVAQETISTEAGSRKRSLSPICISSSPPRKLPKSTTPKKSKKHVKTTNSSKAVYTTPTKSQVTELAKTPMQSQNIFARLTASGEQMKKYPRIPCPVCNVGVTEKFLNIHLDKCLKTDEDPSPIIKRTKSKIKVKDKPSVKEHIAKQVIDDTDDSEGPIAIDSSDDFEEDVFSGQVLTRVKYPRSVVKPSIVETSDDPIVTKPSSENGSADVLGKQVADDEEKVNDEDDAPPPSPTFEQYTDNMTQGSYLQSQIAGGVKSDADMFASGSEAGDENKDDLNSSRNLLELDDDIESMMEAALSEEEEKESNQTQIVKWSAISEQESNETQPVRGSINDVEEEDDSRSNLGLRDSTEIQKQTEPVDISSVEVESNVPARFKKRAFVKVIPVEREAKTPDFSCAQSSSKPPEADPPRSTRRTLRLRSKAKLI